MNDDFVGETTEESSDAVYAGNIFTRAAVAVPTEGKWLKPAPAALCAMQDYALANRKAVKVTCMYSGGTDRRIVCDFSGCIFSVQLYKQNMKGGV